MKISNEFVIKEMGDKTVLVPIGKKAVDLHVLITLNETSVFLLNQMADDVNLDLLAKSLVKEYNVDYEKAYKDVSDFIEKMKSYGVIYE